LAQVKKIATAKAAKPKSSGARKSPLSKAAGRRAPNSTLKRPVATKQPTNIETPGNQSARKKASKKRATAKKAENNKTVSKKSSTKKPASKKASANPKSAAASKKIPAAKVVEATPAAKPQPGKNAGEKAMMGRRSMAAAANSSLSVGETKADFSKQPESGGPAKAKTRKQDSALNESSSQGPGKLGQKKRGWRDIEALTERARLKSLLSDIWHEDIELDSDIFGETDHLSGYYTDKVEAVEVEPEEDEEWEEFEEEED